MAVTGIELGAEGELGPGTFLRKERLFALRVLKGI